MAQKLVYTSDLTGKPIEEADLRSIRLTDHEGTVWRVDATQEELDKLLGKALENATDISAEVQEEQNARYSRYLQSKIEDGTVLPAGSGRTSSRRVRSDAGVSAGGSGLSAEDKAALRNFWRNNAEEVKEEFGSEFREVDRFPSALVEYWTEKGKPSE